MRKGEEDMGRSFDNLGFNNYYTAKSKYAKKQELLADFYRVWYDTFGWGLAIRPFTMESIKNSCWKAANKKTMKVKLIGKGYSSAGIDGLFKAFTEWIAAN